MNLPRDLTFPCLNFNLSLTVLVKQDANFVLSNP